ncbi:MAG: phosphotransferase [Chlorobi bacterium]|nr:phosphotransferase [Chlorobiota bacterium]MCI0715376.1 phosphotransferase [Chlorobiota bacterium]
MDLSHFTQKAYYTALQNLHIKHFGKPVESFEQLKSHGSDRFIVRLKSAGGSSCIGIVNQKTDENKALISFGKTFKAHALNVPEIFIVNKDEVSYLMEDLGDETLLNKIEKSNSFEDSLKSLYKEAIENLTKFQIIAGGDIDYSLCYQFNEFGEENIDYDNNYFKERYLKVFYKNGLDEIQLNKDLEFLKNKVLELQRDFFLYRDFQSRNIMIKEDKLYFIDFQSGRRGALLYDLASLLYDAKANIPQQFREEFLEYYLTLAKNLISVEENKYLHYFWYFALIRILQALGAYGYLSSVKGKKEFLESIPYAVNNINFILTNRIRQNELTYLKKIFETLKENINDKA